MKMLILALTLFSMQAMASDYHCAGEFIMLVKGKAQAVIIDVVITEKNGQRVASVIYNGNEIFKDEPIQTRDNGEPKLERIEQMVEDSEVYLLYGKLAQELYGTKINDILTKTKNTIFEGFFRADTNSGVLLGHHYDADKNLIATEVGIVWFGMGICK